MKYSLFSFAILAMTFASLFAPALGAVAQAATISQFTMTSLTHVCVNGLPRVTAKWTAEAGNASYLLQRKFPNSTLWETTGWSGALTATDATWRAGYGADVYSYRVLGKVATQPMTVNIPLCATTPTPTPTPSGMLWGAYAGTALSDVTTLESLVGAKTDLVATFYGWGDSFPTAHGPSVRDQGKTLVIFWEQYGVTLDQIANGSQDAYMKQFAAAAKAYNGPVILAPFHEMNGNWTPWNGTLPGNSPQKLILAWRHMHDLFEGTTNVRFAWVVNSDSVPDTAANAHTVYYPGDTYVDIVAVDGFNFGSPWQSFDTVFRTPLNLLAQYNKPIYILSMASAQGSGKAAWITDAFTVQIPKYPLIDGWVWFNENKEANWLVNSDPASLAAFKAIIPK